MSENESGDKNATDKSGADKSTQKTQTDERASWTVEDWMREIDRRVNEAHKKWRAEMQETLAATNADAEAKLAKMQMSLLEAEQRADFNERAIAAGISDVTAAYAVARMKNLFTERGCDFDKLKQEHPALFTQTKTGAAAGKQADTQNDGKLNMSRVLAEACGIKPL